MLRAVLAGERGPGGFKLETPPAPPIPIYVAALRGRMLRLGGELGDGTFVNFLPLSAAEQVVGRGARGRAAAGASRTEIVCRFFCIPRRGAAVARLMFAAYATVPVYEAFFRWLGWGEAIDPMVRGLASRRPQAGARAGARGADPRDLHLRRARRAAASACRLRRARHHHAVLDADRAPDLIDELAP